MASWYLEHIVVHDMQTRDKFKFLCQKWLEVEKDDGKVDRVLFGHAKTDLKHFVETKAKRVMHIYGGLHYSATHVYNK